MLLGLPSSSPHIPEKIRPDVIKGLADIEKIMSGAGIDYLFVEVTPEDAPELPALVKALKSKHWDALVVGNGVRSVMELTHFMEQIIDVVRANATAQTKLLFNTTPPTTFDAVKRWFPDRVKSQ